MLGLFDYIYFRWYKVYRKHDKFPESFAAGILTLYQGFTFIMLIVLGCELASVERPDGKFLIPLSFIIYLLNYFHYRKIELTSLEERWKNEPQNVSKLKFYLLTGYLVLGFLSPWIYGFITD